jgi:uncharacterized protein (DUF983 family)
MLASVRSIAGESGKRSRYSASVPEPSVPPDVAAIDRSPSRPTLLLRGLTRRCAWCGDRKAFFVGWFKRVDRCRRCGHGYRRGDHAFEWGAVTANIILTFLLILITIVVSVLLTIPDLEVWWIVGPATAVALIGPAVLYPVSFTLWQAIDLWMRPPTPGELAGTDVTRL